MSPLADAREAYAQLLAQSFKPDRTPRDGEYLIAVIAVRPDGTEIGHSEGRHYFPAEFHVLTEMANSLVVAHLTGEHHAAKETP